LKKSNSVLKILVPYATAHDVKSGVSLALENIVSELSKLENVKIIRLIFQSERVTNIPKSDQFNEVVDIHKYDNAFQALQKIQPDLIYTVPHLEFIGLSFSAAAKQLQIPTAGLVMLGFEKDLSLKSNFFSNFRKIFDNSVPTDIYVNKTSFLRRIRFIFYKFEFMQKTFSALDMNKIQVYTKIKEILFQSFAKNPFYNKLPLTKHFVLNSFQKNTLIQFGFNEKDIIITGHPMFDLALQKNIEKSKPSESSMKILFAPDTLAEPGFWTHERQSQTIQTILTKLKSISNSTIKIKIHPASTKIDYYQNIINEIDSTIPIFKDNSIEHHLKDSDVIVVYSPYSTSLIYALIYRIPIIYCNFYDDMDDIFNLVKSNIAFECKDPTSLSELITNLNTKKDTFEINRIKYIKNYLYSDDGKASERIALEIINMVKNLKN